MCTKSSLQFRDDLRVGESSTRLIVHNNNCLLIDFLQREPADRERVW